MTASNLTLDGPRDGRAAHPLDNPVWTALTGPQAELAERHGDAVRYPADIGPFGALPDDPREDAWADLATLVSAGEVIVLPAADLPAPPAGWTQVSRIAGTQMVATAALRSAPDHEAQQLGKDDVEEVLDLIARTQPGPFAPRTIELGGYLGIRRNGALVAMAGQRMRPPGYTEISAVCTDPNFRGHGLATRLVRAVAEGIRARGEIPFLHAAASNTNAIALYHALGFTIRKSTVFPALRSPE